MNKFFRKLLFLMFATLSLTAATSCENDDYPAELDFVGDSLVARWDLQQSFSSLVTNNYGLSGAGIDYVEGLAGRFPGKTIVVLIGTNNSDLFTSEESRQQYADRYLAAIKALGASKVYLYQLLPRDFETDREGINDDIRAFNDIIAARIACDSQFRYLKVFDNFINPHGSIKVEYYNDRLHLSPAGYEILSNELFKAL
mgnify:CR=1 FL=1